MPPAFLPFHLTRCSLPHAQQVQPTLSPSIIPVPVSSLYPTRSARFYSAFQSLRSHLSSPLFAATLVSPIPLLLIAIAAYLAKVI